MTFHWWYVLIGIGAAFVGGTIYMVRWINNPENWR
jgi:hypothetical protein